MAKKSKDEVPNPQSVTNRDIIQRLNFLYQAGVCMNTIPSSSSSGTSHTASASSSTPTTKKRRTTTHDLAKAYISSMKIVGQKTTVKLDPAVKRTICKGCNAILIPGSTTRVRVKRCASHGHTMVYTCMGCQTSRRIPAPPTLAAGAPEHASTSSTTRLLNSDPRDPDAAMDVSADAAVGDKPPGPSGVRRKRGRKGPVPRRPPLFARDVGHVVFCGNERLDNSDTGSRGDGVFIT